MGNEAQGKYLDDAVRGYIVNFARKHFWRVSSWYEFDDLVQDGYLVYAKCRKGFTPGDAPETEHQRMFMAYFKGALQNHITDLQQDPRSQRIEVAVADLAEGTSLDGEQDLEEAVATIIARAPSEIVDLLKRIFVDGATEVPFLVRTRMVKQHLPGAAVARITRSRCPIRETNIQRIDRCLGAGSAAKLRQFLNESAGLV